MKNDRAQQELFRIRVYALTKSGASFQQVLDVMIAWGGQHRQNIIGKKMKQPGAV